LAAEADGDGDFGNFRKILILKWGVLLFMYKRKFFPFPTKPDLPPASQAAHEGGVDGEEDHAKRNHPESDNRKEADDTSGNQSPSKEKPEYSVLRDRDTGLLHDIYLVKDNRLDMD